jgi:hypothetical protein
MIPVGEYSDTLRGLGRLLEQVGALQITIADRPYYLEVAWSDGNGTHVQRYYQQHEVWALRTTALMYRGLEEGAHRFGAAELLRTLGRALDQLGAKLVTIQETDEGFSVTGTIDGLESKIVHSYDELVAQAQEYHRQRGGD